MFLSFSIFQKYKIPTFKTLIRWLTQLGYYKLIREKEKADDWFYILDNSIQVGTAKCLLILGCRLSCVQDLFKEGKALTFRDLEPIELVISKNINAEVVCGAIERAAEKTNPPCGICKDGGPDVNPGFNLYVSKNKTKTVGSTDTAHKVGNLLKKELEHHPEWIKYSRLCTTTKQKVQQTPIAYLMPPNQRSKMRFMNIDIPIGWGEKMLTVMENPQDILAEHREQVQREFGWVLDMKLSIQFFANLITIAQIAREEIRTHGIYPTIVEIVETKLISLPSDFRTYQFAGKVLDFLQEQALLAREAGKTLIGTTEPIESFYGKLKSISGNSNNEFTSLVLGSLAFTGEVTIGMVAEALATCRIKDVVKWTKANIGSTLLSDRRKHLKSEKTKDFKFYDTVLYPFGGKKIDFDEFILNEPEDYLVHELAGDSHYEIKAS